MNKWDEVFEQQHQLWKWFGTEDGNHFADRVLAGSIGRPEGPSNNEPWNLGNTLHQVLFQADPFVVSDDMMTLWEAAADDFPPEQMIPEDLIVPYGFVLLPRERQIKEWANQKASISYRAFCWHRSHSPTDPKWQGVGVGIFIHMDDYLKRNPNQNITRSWFPDLIIEHWEPFLFHNERVKLPKNRWMREIQAFWRLTQQYVTTPSKATPSRPSRRRAERDGFKSKDVVVVTLRRKSRPTASTGTVDWSHQWIVNKHWRNQWYPSLGTHRYKYIDTYVKGPEDKPLIRKDRVFDVRR